VNAGVGLNEDAFCGEALRAVAGDVQGAPYEHGVDTSGPIEDAGAVKDLIRQGEIGLISIANALGCFPVEGIDILGSCVSEQQR